ncbi:MAG: TonB-dependent receptor, partial [Pseudomonadota bacterium]
VTTFRQADACLQSRASFDGSPVSQRHPGLVQRVPRALLPVFAASALMLFGTNGHAAVQDSSDLEVVVVTASRTPQKEREAAIRTDVLSDTVIRGSGSRSLADAISLIPLARSENNCQNCNTTEIQLLGLPGAYNQILFEGLPLFSGVASVYGVEQIPAPLVDQIEVLKGGASALYGPGAVAGVINVISKKPSESEGSVYGTYENRDGDPYQNLGAYGALVSEDNRFSLSAFGQFEAQDPRDLNSDGYTELVDRQQGTGGFLGRYQVSSDTLLSANYQYTDESRRGGNRLNAPSFLANISEEIDTEFHRGSLSLSHFLAPDLQIEAIYGFAQIERASFYGGLGDVETDPLAPDFDSAALESAIEVSREQFGSTEDRLQYFELRGLGSVGAHDLSVAVQCRTESVTDVNENVDGEALNTLVDDTFGNLGLLIQDEWVISETTRLLLGLRADRSSEVDNTIFSPRLGLWYAPNSEWVFRANISTGFRAPEVFNEDIHIDTLGAQPIRVVNADELKEETSLSYAIGFDFNPAWRENLLAINGQLYLTELEDTFFLGDIQEAIDGSLFQVRNNAGESSVFGGELTATLRPSANFQLSLSAAYVDAGFDEAQLVFEEGDTALSTSRYLKTPRWTGIAQAMYAGPAEIDAFLAVRYTGSMQVLNNNLGTLTESESFTEIDLTATKHLDGVLGSSNLDITLGVRNLLDEFQGDLEVGANRDSDYVYGPRLPRTAFLSFQVDL